MRFLDVRKADRQTLVYSMTLLTRMAFDSAAMHPDARSAWARLIMVISEEIDRIDGTCV